MSCCDDAKVVIDNNSGANLEVTALSIDVGTLSGVKVGDIVKSGSPLSLTASAKFWSKGAASGSLTLKSSSNPPSILALTYAFTPKNWQGGCPCSSTVSTTPVASGNLSAAATTVTGKSSGNASITWAITSQPI